MRLIIFVVAILSTINCYAKIGHTEAAWRLNAYITNKLLSSLNCLRAAAFLDGHCYNTVLVLNGHFKCFRCLLSKKRIYSKLKVCLKKKRENNVGPLHRNGAEVICSISHNEGTRTLRIYV